MLQYYPTLHCPALHYKTLHYITLHYITLSYIILHYITVDYIKLHYITLYYCTLHYTNLDYTVVQGPVCEQCTNHAKHLPGSCDTSALHCSLRSALYCTVNYYIVVYWNALHCTVLSTVLHCNRLHNTQLQLISSCDLHSELAWRGATVVENRALDIGVTLNIDYIKKILFNKQKNIPTVQCYLWCDCPLEITVCRILFGFKKSPNTIEYYSLLGKSEYRILNTIWYWENLNTEYD